MCIRDRPKGVFISHLEDICRNKNAYVVSGVAEKKSSKFFNSSVLIGPEGYISTYRKLHLFDREKLFFEPGNKQLEVYDIGKAKVGLMICFDWIFPETTRILALKGAEIICHSANLVLPYSQTAMLARSVENVVYTITANRIGIEKNDEIDLNFTGQSQITSPRMETLAKAEKDTIELSICRFSHLAAEILQIDDNDNFYIWVYYGDELPIDLVVLDSSFIEIDRIEFKKPYIESFGIWIQRPIVNPDGNIYEFRGQKDGLHVIRWSREE